MTPPTTQFLDRPDGRISYDDSGVDGPLVIAAPGMGDSRHSYRHLRDGLTEAGNEEGDLFGEERLQELLPELRSLSAEAAGSRLLAAADRFIGEARLSDDLSLVLLKRSGSKSAPRS